MATRSGTPRADVVRNEALVLDAARRGISLHGLAVTHNQIARLAGVGVGTVYRRFPERGKLLTAVLLAILDELCRLAEEALADADAAAGFRRFFLVLAQRAREHWGLSRALDEQGGRQVASARERLVTLIRQLVHRAQEAGALRRDVQWQDIPSLATAAGNAASMLRIEAQPNQAERFVDVILRGLSPLADDPA